MMVKKEDLTENKQVIGSFNAKVKVGNVMLPISLDPDDLRLEETLILANKNLKDFTKYESQAKDIIAEEFLENYNENWKEDEGPILSKEEFLSNLILNGINFLSNECVDIFYSENGMFGDHSLITQSTDEEHFNDVIMFG